MARWHPGGRRLGCFLVARDEHNRLIYICAQLSSTSLSSAQLLDNICQLFFKSLRLQTPLDLDNDELGAELDYYWTWRAALAASADRSSPALV